MAVSFEADVSDNKAPTTKAPSMDGQPETIEHVDDLAMKGATDESKLEVNAPREERVTPKAWACVFVRCS